jgi:hypothetical protein
MQIHPILLLSTLFIYLTLSGLGATEKSFQIIYVSNVSGLYQAVQKANRSTVAQISIYQAV